MIFSILRQNFNKSYSPFYNNIHRRNFIPPNYSSFPFSPNTLKSSNSNFFPNNQESEKKSDSKNNNIQSNTPSKSLPPNKDFVLDLFGLKLYFDDVLILSLIFFLYKEDVKDEGLFLALVLLLIS